MEIDKEYSTINYYDRKVELYNLPWEEKIILLWGWTWRAMIISFIIGIISVPILIVCIILFTVLAGSSGNPSSINNSELYAAISFVVVSAITIIIIFIHTFYVTTQRISDMVNRLSFPRISCLPKCPPERYSRAGLLHAGGLVGIQNYVVTHFWIPCLRRAG